MTALANQVIDPYAEALMSLAQQQNLVDQFGQDIASLADLLKASPELEKFLGNPVIKGEAKKAVLRQIGTDQIHPILINFLALLVDRRRIVFLGAICDRFQALYRKLKQITLAEIITAVELSSEQRQAVTNKVLEMSGASQVELQVKIDPQIIGGVVIKIGSQVFDSSLRGQLRRLAAGLGSSI
jgi:F-type H+-transporting ATPase subunit delta